ncbi:MAG: ComF family protein [Deltaproteobacteria bacterium]|nr:ComF family protein [Deltaproteobacteria bacterium]
MRYLWLYKENARDLIACMKYRPSPQLCKIAASVLAEALDMLYPLPDWDLIVPLPSSRRSERKRCFNQCLVLARALQEKLSGSHPAKLDTSALRHLGCKHAQASLDHDRRISNVKGAFWADPIRVRGARILLVDDVITSGATSATATVALLKAGAVAVDLIALAKAHAWEERRYEIYKEIR